MTGTWGVPDHPLILDEVAKVTHEWELHTQKHITLYYNNLPNIAWGYWGTGVKLLVEFIEHPRALSLDLQSVSPTFP